MSDDGDIWTKALRQIQQQREAADLRAQWLDARKRATRRVGVIAVVALCMVICPTYVTATRLGTVPRMCLRQVGEIPTLCLCLRKHPPLRSSALRM